MVKSINLREITPFIFVFLGEDISYKNIFFKFFKHFVHNAEYADARSQKSQICS